MQPQVSSQHSAGRVQAPALFFTHSTRLEVLWDQRCYITFPCLGPLPLFASFTPRPNEKEHAVLFLRAVWNILTMIFQAIFDRMDFTGWLLLGFALLLLTDVIRNWRPHNLPPGPWAVPFLGNVFTGVDFKTMEKVRWTVTLRTHTSHQREWSLTRCHVHVCSCLFMYLSQTNIYFSAAY